MRKIICYYSQGHYDKFGDTITEMEYIKQLGLEVVKWSYSTFGACFFFEVYNPPEDPAGIYRILDVDPNTFNWNQ